MQPENMVVTGASRFSLRGTVYDQFGQPFVGGLVTWAVSGGPGTASPTGLYSAPAGARLGNVAVFAIAVSFGVLARPVLGSYVENRWLEPSQESRRPRSLRVRCPGGSR